jgi:hypothetical protein
MRRLTWILAVAVVPGCVVREYREPPYREPPPQAYAPPPPPPEAPPPPVAEVEVRSVYLEPPVEQPEAVAIPYAPPPMRWDPPPPSPYWGAVWIGGHWTWWDGEWVWARGHWARPPSASYVWCEPYYEYRGANVIFVAGFWRPAVRVFVPPPPTVYVRVVTVRPNVVYARPIGPHGVFVPPPPGSQPGVIVPAPVGTPPSVVVSAPPVARPGMVIRPAVSRGGTVEVVAPPGVTRTGQPVNANVPAAPQQAAALHPVVAAPPPPVVSTGGPIHPQPFQDRSVPGHGPPPQAQGAPPPFQSNAGPQGGPPPQAHAAPPPFQSNAGPQGGPPQAHAAPPPFQSNAGPQGGPPVARPGQSEVTERGPVERPNREPHPSVQAPPRVDEQRATPGPKPDHNEGRQPASKSVPPKGPTHEKPKPHDHEDR